MLSFSWDGAKNMYLTRPTSKILLKQCQGKGVMSTPWIHSTHEFLSPPPQVILVAVVWLYGTRWQGIHETVLCCVVTDEERWELPERDMAKSKNHTNHNQSKFTMINGDFVSNSVKIDFNQTPLPMYWSDYIDWVWHDLRSHCSCACVLHLTIFLTLTDFQFSSQILHRRWKLSDLVLFLPLTRVGFTAFEIRIESKVVQWTTKVSQKVVRHISGCPRNEKINQ